MKKNRKTFLACIISIMMVLVMAVPVSVSAAETEPFKVAKGTKTQYFTDAQSAVASVNDNETATITLQRDYSGGGVKIEGTGKNITFELGENTWTVEEPLVGSTGTETNAFQLLKDNTVTFKNGTITSNVAKIIFQNYCNLTIDNVKVELKTTDTGCYAASNNNGTTVIKGGSSITVPEGNFALDAFKFAGYSGGNVILDGVYIEGDVEVANGGKLTVDSAIIEGNVNVYNYGTGSGANESGIFTMNAGLVSGDVTTSQVGQTIFNGGGVEGEVTLDNSKGASAVINSGAFQVIRDNVEIKASDIVVISDAEETATVVGIDFINDVLGLLADSEYEINVEVIKAAEGSNFEVPDGIKVENSTDSPIKVNNDEVKAGEIIEVGEDDTNETGPSTPSTTPSDPSKTPADDSADTGDNSNLLIPMILMLIAAAGIGTTVAVRGRK